MDKNPKIFATALHVMNKDLKNILLEKMQERKIKIPKLAEITGIPKDRIYKWFQQDTNPKYADREILEKWIKNAEMDNVPRVTDTPSPSYLEQRRAQKNNHAAFMVPLIPVKAQSGYVKAMDQEMYVETMEKYALPPGVNPQGAVWRYWEIEGQSMEPEYRSGDVLLTSQVPYEDWENLRNFYAYVIVTGDAVLFKRIYCKNGLEWVLISENEKDYPQKLIPVEMIREVWFVRRVIKSKLPPIKMFEIKV